MSEIEKFLEILFSAPSSPISASKAMEVRDWWDKAKIQYADRINACGADGWISVGDALPNNGDAILTIGVNEKGEIMNAITAVYFHGKFMCSFQFSGGRHISFAVETFPTHWMQLPRPPEVAK